nr:MAG TPA_asm: putative protease [Caudoviricetes sp.]
MNDETKTGAENTNDAPPAAQPADSPATPPAAQESTPQADKPAVNMPDTLLNKAVDTKPDEKQNGKDAPKEDETEKPVEGAPEKYEEFKAPEGTMLDAAVMQKFGEVAKELNLPQDKAQDVVDKMAPLMVQRQMQQIAGISQQWAEKSSNDPEIADHLNDIARIRDMFGKGADGNFDPDIAEFINSPAGNHPGVLKLLARVGARFGEAGFPQGTAAPAAEVRITASDIYHRRK